ncbi:MAG TPA: rhomboid family intramembrane serine protease [Planctomicrobium sp.]|nr:rhomboid family intramembrane serine protease [Planctomicrobium sp.]
MFPIRDDIPSRTTPFVNYAVIAICCMVFFAQISERPGEPTLVERYGMIPLRISDPKAPVEIVVDARHVQTPEGIKVEYTRREAFPPAVPPLLTMLTCVFLHGSWMHLIGNMWFLFIFGDNIEDRFGHVGYLLFYLFCGVAASGAHYLAEATSMIPTIGASGAIAGVMGAYLVWYPGAKVQALIPLGVILQVLVVPAPLFLGLWFILQLFSGVGTAGGAESGGVAWWAHIGGFVVGAGLAAILGSGHAVKPANLQRRPNPAGFSRIRN